MEAQQESYVLKRKRGRTTRVPLAQALKKQKQSSQDLNNNNNNIDNEPNDDDAMIDEPYEANGVNATNNQANSSTTVVPKKKKKKKKDRIQRINETYAMIPYEALIPVSTHYYSQKNSANDLSLIIVFSACPVGTRESQRNISSLFRFQKRHTTVSIFETRGTTNHNAVKRELER
jgi:hypothetical protein